MTVASKKHIVKRRMDDYVWRDNTLASRRLRKVLESHFQRFDNIAIVGGMVRDFARVGKTGFVSDVDLVIDAPADEVADTAHASGAKGNAFGGFSISEPGWSLDFWALETTWAVRKGHVQANSLRDFTRSTFFDYDAIMYDVRRRTIVCDDGYLEGLHNRVMDVNLLPNPTTVGNLFRAVRRILLWELSPGPCLTRFIVDNLTDANFSDIVKADKRKSASPFLHKYQNALDLRDAVICPENRRRMSTYYGQQLRLPGFERDERA
ncbi:hypothetical protein [Agrobacterium tumefaciens]|uniref:Poly A polymerase head domain-containing protein n=1 Tax=Agrobacterium tumefaciens TaxID=358 RepID=A0A2L2LHC9_AGRTU|nr:hypothetical protein [Agrobacterium tumefaciens]AVH43719.1 hypothetical protein At1D1609_36660 [Agrobacterium tumefaciens]NSY97659.1 hypothetical protein [Agrobacterium tumefaciens]